MVEFSVVIAGRDVEKVLGQCLGSLQRTRFRDFEVIYVDDASTDASVEIAESQRRGLPALTALQNSASEGPAAARNRGLDRASGEYVAFLDADDWLGVNALGTMRSILHETDVDFVRVDHVRVEGIRRFVWRAPEWRRWEVLSPQESILPVNHSTMVDYPFPPFGAYRRRLLDAGLLHFSWPGLRTAEDWPWNWRLHLSAKSFMVVPLLEHFYRRDDATSLSQVGDVRQLDYLKAFVHVLEMSECVSPDVHLKAQAQFLTVASHHLREDVQRPREMRNLHRQLLGRFLTEGHLPNASAAIARLPAEVTGRIRDLVGKWPD